MPGATTTTTRSGRQGFDRGDDMGDQRPAGERVQNFWQARFHSRSLARGKNNRGERWAGHGKFMG